MKKRALQWLIPLLFFLILVPFFPFLDTKISNFFYTPSLESKGYFVDNAFTSLIYNYGEWPAFLLCDGCFILFVLSFFLSSLKKWRAPLCAVVITFLLGAGLLVNGILKEYIERPRPRQTIELGGKYAFRPVHKPHFIVKQKPDGQKSFPSGHVTTGAYFFILILVGRRLKNRSILLTGIGMAAFWTPLLIMARIMQGAHFLSDTLAATLFMWLTALFVEWLVWEFLQRRNFLPLFPRERSSNIK